jgi:hypothetical protein
MLVVKRSEPVALWHIDLLNINLNNEDQRRPEAPQGRSGRSQGGGLL